MKKSCTENFSQIFALSLIAVFLLVFLFSDPTFAGTTGSEFKSIYTKVKDWSTGYLGRLLALCTFIIGLGASIMRQTLFPALTGIGVALVVSLGPALIEGIATGTF